MRGYVREEKRSLKWSRNKEIRRKHKVKVEGSRVEVKPEKETKEESKKRKKNESYREKMIER